MKDLIQEVEYAILVGDFRPKQKLVEADLMQRFSVGRGAIRETLKILSDRGLVWRNENKGSTVRELCAREIRDLYSLRSYLEGIAGKLAFDKITSKDIKELSKLQEELKNYAQVDKGLVKRHEVFHEIIFRASGNLFLFEQIKRLIALSGSVRYFSYTYPDQRKRNLQEHDQMIECFESRNKNMFIGICRNHMIPGMEDYIRIFYPHESIDLGKEPDE
ncbi:MAG: GntR family transcriptional regulator [Syntrophobacteraceae bacterium]